MKSTLWNETISFLYLLLLAKVHASYLSMAGSILYEKLHLFLAYDAFFILHDSFVRNCVGKIQRIKWSQVLCFVVQNLNPYPGEIWIPVHRMPGQRQVKLNLTRGSNIILQFQTSFQSLNTCVHMEHELTLFIAVCWSNF